MQVQKNSVIEQYVKVPSFVDSSDTIETFERKATEAVAVCYAFDLETQIAMGRIILAVKELHKFKECPHRTNKWFKDNDISLKKAQSLQKIAKEADRLIDEQKLTQKGIDNINPLAFEKVITEAPEAIEVLVYDAENGETVNVDEAKQLIDKQKVNRSELESLKDSVRDGYVKANIAAKLIDNLQQIKEESVAYSETQEIKKSLEVNSSHDNVKALSDSTKALRKYEENVVSSLITEAGIDSSQLLAEGVRLDVLPLLADTVASIRKVENLALSLSLTLSKLSLRQDMLYVESGASNPETRSLCELISSNKQGNRKIVLSLNLEELMEKNGTIPHEASKNILIQVDIKKEE